MAFNQHKLDKVYNQSRGIFDKWIYRSDDDTIAEITATGYFSESRFAKYDRDWIDGPILMDVVDSTGAFYQVKVVDGVGSVVGGNLDTPSIEAFGGVGGNQTLDSAAVQAIIDAGFPGVYLPPKDTPYELIGLTVPQGQAFYFTSGSQKAKVNIRGTMITYGDISTQTNIFLVAENINFIICDDCTNGIFNMLFCRNGVFRNLQISDNSGHTAIGCLARLDRSYQISFDHILIISKGIGIYELMDTTGSEVLDTVTVNENCVFHSNIGPIVRNDGSQNFHNITTKAKFRDVSGEPEDTIANNGETTLTSGYSVGDEQISVDDYTQLKQGNLTQDDLIIVADDASAEVVRVTSASTGTINITPLRFDKESGASVIFGCMDGVYDSVRSLVIPQMHSERSWVAASLRNCKGVAIGSMYMTSRHGIRMKDNCREVSVGPITVGNVGWSQSDILHIPPSHTSASPNRDIYLNAMPEGSTGGSLVVMNNESNQATDDMFIYNGGTSKNINRGGTTTINVGQTKRAIIDMDGNINNLNLVNDSFFDGSSFSIVFRQDGTGGRRVVNNQLGVTIDMTSAPANSIYIYEFYYDGSAWSITSEITNANNAP